MGLFRPPGFAGIKSWVVRLFNARISKIEHPSQAPAQSVSHARRPYSSNTNASTPRTASQVVRPLQLGRSQARGFHQFPLPKFNRNAPRFVRIKLQSTSFFLRPQVGAFPRSPWAASVGGRKYFHSSPATNAIALQQVADSVSTALRNGLHPQTRLPAIVPGRIVAEVSARAACQNADGPAGYIRFTLAPPPWTPTETDLSDPEIIEAIDTHIAELQRIKTALLKLKKYGDFPVRAVLPSNPEATIDVLFRGVTADDVARWNKNEFKLGSGRVGADQVFCAARFEDNVKWSEILDAERKVDKEMRNKNGDATLLKFWDELNMMEGRIH